LFNTPLKNSATVYFSFVLIDKYALHRSASGFVDLNFHASCTGILLLLLFLLREAFLLILHVQCFS
jgi:hypothetical protein